MNAHFNKLRGFRAFSLMHIEQAYRWEELCYMITNIIPVLLVKLLSSLIIKGKTYLIQKKKKKRSCFPNANLRACHVSFPFITY